MRLVDKRFAPNKGELYDEYHSLYRGYCDVFVVKDKGFRCILRESELLEARKKSNGLREFMRSLTP